jgi:hypothetical protein
MGASERCWLARACERESEERDLRGGRGATLVEKGQVVGEGVRGGVDRASAYMG